MKYRDKTAIIDAVQWTGENFDEVVGFCQGYNVRLNTDGSLSITTGLYRKHLCEGDYIKRAGSDALVSIGCQAFERDYELVPIKTKPKSATKSRPEKDCAWLLETRRGGGKWEFFGFIHGDPGPDVLRARLGDLERSRDGYKFKASLFVRAGG